MDRAYTQPLQHWYQKKHRKPLIIRGARQVGKSTLVRRFAESSELQLFEVNLERHPNLRYAAESLDPATILREVEFICGKGAIHPARALLFFDEIQETPVLLQALRYFYEEYPQLPVIAAGSLLEFTLRDHSFPMPVGRVEYFHMGPVSFEEFLAAKGADHLVNLLQIYDLKDPFPISAHGRLIALLRDYLLVGGMPEAVQLYVDGSSFDEIFEAQESIYQTYRDDFSKYAHGSALLRLQKILDYLGQGAGKKIKYSNIDSHSQSRETKQALDLIIKAGLVLEAKHSHGDGVPLSAQAVEKVFKLFCLDIGIYNRICRLNSLPDRALHDPHFVNQGALAESFIAQQLNFGSSPARKPELFYWLREGRSNNAEVDFLIEVGQRVVPIEIKSGKGGSLRSLFQFAQAKGSSQACRFDLNPPSQQTIRHEMPHGPREIQLLSLPLYFCQQAARLLQTMS